MQSALPLRVTRRRLCFFLLFIFGMLAPRSVRAQQQLGQIMPKMPPPGTDTTLEADQQREVGKIFYFDGHVDVKYGEARLRADHVEYDSDAQTVVAHGNVQLDYLTQHIDADDARY